VACGCGFSLPLPLSLTLPLSPEWLTVSLSLDPAPPSPSEGTGHLAGRLVRAPPPPWLRIRVSYPAGCASAAPGMCLGGRPSGLTHEQRVRQRGRGAAECVIGLEHTHKPTRHPSNAVPAHPDPTTLVRCRTEAHLDRMETLQHPPCCGARLDDVQRMK
jgi:hypothetical protein